MVKLNPPPENPRDSDPNQIYDILLKDIFADEIFNARGRISPLNVMELAREISENGLIQPITVQPYLHMPGYKYRIVAGYRRYAAHQQLEARTIKSSVRLDLTDLDARLINLIENTQRENLDIVQEANAIKHFHLAGWTQDEISTKTGKSRGWVQVRICLLELPHEIQEDAKNGLISQGDILKIYGLRDVGFDAQFAYVKQLKDARLLNKKRKPKPEAIVITNRKEARDSEEIFKMQDAIQDCTKVDDPMAKALAWSAGALDDNDFNTFVKDYVRRVYNRHYSCPELPEKLPAQVE